MVDLLREIATVGTDPTCGGYSRPVYSDAELTLPDWFVDHAGRRRPDVDTDRNGIVWAWWNLTSGPRVDAVVTGSHLDSVLGGGAFDGPLGVASALAAVDQLQAAGARPARPLGLAVFPEEEGSRFGIACLGARLLTVDISPARPAALTDPDGVKLHLPADHGALGVEVRRGGERAAGAGGGCWRAGYGAPVLVWDGEGRRRVRQWPQVAPALAAGALGQLRHRQRGSGWRSLAVPDPGARVCRATDRIDQQQPGPDHRI